VQECTSFKAAAKESEKAAAAAQVELARAAEAHQAAVTAHGEEASRLRRIAKKKAEELEELQVGGCGFDLLNVLMCLYGYRGCDALGVCRAV
jgi:hypothetical protein